MKDFEGYIKENRDEMDIHTPGPEVWNRIERGLATHQRRSYTWLWRAAIIIIAAGAALSVIAGSLSAGKTPGTTMKIVRETEQYYNNQFYNIYNQAKPVLISNPEIDNELRAGMEELDSICTEIKHDLKDNAANKEVVEALICNYRLRIELLEDMLSIIKEEESKNEKPTDHEI